MNGAIWGVFSALLLGTADFMASSSTQHLGARSAFGAVLLTGTIILGLAIWLTGQPLVWSPRGLIFATLHGAFVTAMSLLLYTALARGPISVVVAIVISHPAIVLLVQVLWGSQISDMQWAAIMAVLLGSIMVTLSHSEEQNNQKLERTTVLIAVATSLLYAGVVLSGQIGASYLGHFQTIWVGRNASLMILCIFFIALREQPAVSLAWVPYLIAQGAADSLGYFALIAGTQATFPEAAAVTASAFGIVTILLARLLFKETINQKQYGAIALSMFGILILASA